MKTTQKEKNQEIEKANQLIAFLNAIKGFRGEYKQIPFNPNYYALNDGRIWSLKRKMFVTESAHFSGYRFLNTKLRVDESGQKKLMLVHKIIGITFLGDFSSEKEINHINGIKEDNRACNLEWVTHRQNLQHAARNNLLAPIKKLNEKQVREIRKIRAEENLSMRKIGNLFNVSRGAVESILCGRSWQYVA